MPVPVILANVFGAAVMIAVFTASGARVRRRLRLPTGPSDRWAADLLIGAGLCSLWILPLAQMTAIPALALEAFRVPGLLHWWAFIRFLGPPLEEKDGLRTYVLPST